LQCQVLCRLNLANLVVDANCGTLLLLLDCCFCHCRFALWSLWSLSYPLYYYSEYIPISSLLSSSHCKVPITPTLFI
jgi:hypothetical protein